MILIDLSSAFHKCTHGLAAGILKETKADFVDLKLYQKEFNLSMLNVLCTHINMFREYATEIVICLDETSGRGNWRKKIFPMYKYARQQFRQSFTKFDYQDAYILFDNFVKALKASQAKTLFKVVDVDHCEADDLILVLARDAANKGEPVMILSPDKDFIQLQDNPLIRQYSWMTNKILRVDDKTGDVENGMQEWLLEHVCLGDQADNVPRIVDFKEFKPGVREYLVESGLIEEDEDAWSFSSSYFNYDDFEAFGGVFEREKFGLATLKKRIKEVGGLENFLDLDPCYRKNYYRNRQLVLEEGIPMALREQIISEYLDDSKNVQDPATKLVEGLKLQGTNLPDLISNKYISEQQLGSLLDW